MTPDTFDGYIGCGVDVFRPATYMHPNTPFKHAVKKYGTSAFIRTTIQVFDNETDAYKLEAELVNEQFVKREDTYNLTLGGRHAEHINSKVKVYMYDLDGNFEMEFKSVTDAAKHLNPKCKEAGHLSRAIRQGHQFLGHQFSYERLPYMKKLKNRNLSTIGPKVGKFDDNGNLIETYETMTDCVKAGYKNAKLVARGKRDHCKGYVFKYLN